MSTDSIEQSLNENIFLKNIMDDSKLQDTELNRKYWFTETKGSSLDKVLSGRPRTSFFIVKKYDDKGYSLNDAGSYVRSDNVTLSDNITTGLENKNYFFFDDYGNIQLCLEPCSKVSESSTGPSPYTQDLPTDDFFIMCHSGR